ncbi:helix-turn-helix domain-containing protein [Streptomyces sp. NPDC051555]|uniref:helix-turn-helix domain-containing protein n=1 Tax=Streptomyces sp. NPDC051555 TaxID=3365657 RepID=UPI0037A60F44
MKATSIEVRDRDRPRATVRRLSDTQDARQEPVTPARAGRSSADRSARQSSVATPALKPRPKGKHLTGVDRREFIREITAAYTQGAKTIQQIADATGRSHSSIHRYLVKAGIAMRGRGSPKKSRGAR